MYIYKCEILKVVDGDTLYVLIDLGFNIKMKERVRLLGVDTPEIFGPKAVAEGKTASDFTKTWVETQQKLKGHFELHSKKYDSREKYGRVLGTIKFVSGTGSVEDLTETLIKMNLIK